MSANVLLNLLNELRCPQCNNKGARMQTSVYQMTLKSHFIGHLSFSVRWTSDFRG